MMCIVILAGAFDAPTWAGICTPGVLALSCVTAEQASQRTIPIGGFPDHRQHIRNNGDRSSRLSTDAEPEDAEPDVIAFVLSLRDRLQPESRP
jgi:hypothetical protein